MKLFPVWKKIPGGWSCFVQTNPVALYRKTDIKNYLLFAEVVGENSKGNVIDW